MADLEFYGKSHTYMVDGVRIPCVSDLTRFISREVYTGAPAWRLEAAAAKGTAVHSATELLDKTGRAEIDSDYAPYLEAYAAFLREHEVSWELIEKADYHPEMMYAGTVDRYGAVDGFQTLVDLKTTFSTEKKLWSAGLNFYRMMLEARGYTVQRLLILHLKRDGSYKLIPIGFDDSVPMACYTIHTALTRGKRGKNVRRTEES